MNLQPRNDRVFIRLAEVKRETESGILLPARDKHHTDIGTVVAAGPKAEDVATGDRVILLDHAAEEKRIDGERLFVVRQEDILAIVES